jgi:hypothetical protein
MFKTFWAMSATGALLFGAFSSSPTYQLQSYGLGSGGTNEASSANYRLNASSGELGGTPSAGGTTQAGSGSTETRQANVPLAPTLSNGSNTFYNKLQVTINTSGSDAGDYTYSIAVSTNNFATTTYVQADGTLGSTAVYQSYATWGGASGSPIIGLSPNTTYKAKVNAMQGNFTNSAYGPAATAVTANPSLAFSITPSTVSLGSLLPGTVNAGSSNLSFNFATNGASGGSVYIAGANSGLRSAATNNTISSANANLSAAAEGFGVQGLTATQASGGPFTIAAPFNGTSNTVGGVNTSFRQIFTSSALLTGGTATASVKGKSSATTASASDYTETLTFIASASF